MTRSPVAECRKSPQRHSKWRAALLAPLLSLATCGPAADTGIGFATASQPPIVAATAPARFSDSHFIAVDGAQLPLRKWLPKGPVKAVVLALHGFGDYSNAFDMPGKAWAERGIATYAYDQRGFGGAPSRGEWAGEQWLVVDAITATRLLRRAYPGQSVYLLGESMGGAVAILATTGATSGGASSDGGPTADIDGLILSAPAVWGRSTMDFLPKMALFTGVRLFPAMNLTGSGLRIRASDNLPMLRALARDPLVLKGARIATIFGLVDLMDTALAAAAHLDAPMLLLYGAHDELVPRRPIMAFVADLPPVPRNPRRLAYYAAGYHLLLRDLQGPKVTDDIASWIIDRTAPLPSRADDTASAKPWPPSLDRSATVGATEIAPAGLAPTAAKR